MRWDRLFDELEGHVRHAELVERDALVADLREGEWAERSWIDGLADTSPTVELSVLDVGVMTGTVRWATTSVIHVQSASAHHLIAAAAVQWVRGADRSPGLARDSVRARLGWGPVLREAQDERDLLAVTLVGGMVLEGRVTAVGRDFVRLGSDSVRERDIPTDAVRVVTFVS